MNTREQVQAVIQPFIDEYQGKHGIWGIAVGAGPSEYNEYGKPRHSNKNEYIDWALHVFSSAPDAIDHLPDCFNKVKLMIFVSNE